ncbi:glycosyltransferase family 4 protein [Amylibacter sp.]|nr:glycosyltransferase family 4 protein [Amylibacter sp.]MDC1455773.1 glycosyltransferase family 4 protein [Amylibacter sp.]
MVALIIGKVENKHKRFKEKLANKISNANLSDRIIFTGEIKAESMPKVMSAISLLITLPRYEGYGMTPLESLASGTPFVGTKTGYFEEFSSHGKYGSVVGLGDVDGATGAIIDWLSKNDKLDDFSKNAQQYILKNHSIEKEVNGIIEAYKSLLDNKE